MILESYQKFYDEEYRTLYGDDDVGKDNLYKIRKKQGEEVFEYIKKKYL